MGARAAERRAAVEVAEAERRGEAYARLVAEAGPPLPGEHEYVFEEGEHRGHRAHIHPWHGLGVTCQCGAFMGIFSGVVEFSPDPCPVCIARGMPLGER